MSIEHGVLDVDGIGYLYRVAVDAFEPAGHWEWIARTRVKPIDCEIVRTSEYRHWII